ncbi:MAG: hypothetical protein ILP18_05625 [Treponema sp.]|nr:hypothetical protein [Treponema sp.]
MIRYCPNCHKEFDFAIKSIEDLDDLVCPECGCKIDRNSRRPLEEPDEGGVDMSLGLMLLVLVRIGFVFFALLSLLGVGAFFLHWSWGLRILTGICLLVFLMQLALGVHQFRSGPVFLPLGAAAGFFFLRSLDGVFLGIAAVFIVRHVLLEFVFWLFGKLFGFVVPPDEEDGGDGEYGEDDEAGGGEEVAE